MGSRPHEATPEGVPRRLAGDERREALLAAALSLFAETGADGVSFDEVATRAGVSRPLVYHYFPGRQALYLAALRLAADDLLTALEGARGASGRPGLSRALTAYFDYAEAHRDGYLVFVAASLGALAPEAREIVDEVHEFLVEELLVPLVGETGHPLAAMALRGWIAMVEVTGSGWARDRHVPRRCVEDFLVSVLPIVFEEASHTRVPALPAPLGAPGTAPGVPPGEPAPAGRR